MKWRKWKRKLPCSRTEDNPYETAGPTRDCTPATPPPNNPPPSQERDRQLSDITSRRRWAYAIRVAHCCKTLLWLIWIMLPPEVRDMLINTVQR